MEILMFGWFEQIWLIKKCRFWLWTDGLVWKMLEKSAKSHHFRTVEKQNPFLDTVPCLVKGNHLSILISQKFHVHGIVPYVHFPNEFRMKTSICSMRFSSPSFPIAPHFAQETMRQAVKALVEAKADARRPFFSRGSMGRSLGRFVDILDLVNGKSPVSIGKPR